jgi:thiosulfate reductase cytochrome b subunit
MKNRTLIYTRFNRLWHWLQALFVMGLAVTGFSVHFTSVQVLAFDTAVHWHRIFAWSYVILIAFAMFWHLTSGQWKQYVPTSRMLPEMVVYYVAGIFRGDEKPVHKTVREKLNPLQRLTYTGLLILVIPVLVGTGFLYLYFNELGAEGFGISLGLVAVVHTLGAFLMIAFLIAHVYLATTGETVTENLRAMVTGYEDIDDEDPDESAEVTT